MQLLRGVRVIDVSSYIFGPAAAAVLAHWGADVIKVESPGMPDPMRGAGPAGPTATFHHYNRGKRAIAVNLTTEAGQAVLRRLVRDVDVFVTNHLPRTRAKLHIDVADVHAWNPRIVYARASGQGPLGPDAEQGAYDITSWWARGSLAAETMRVAGAEWPTFLVGHGDGMSGLVLAGGICAALLHRERTGTARVVDGSLLGTAAWFNAPSIISSMTDGTWPDGRGPRDGNPPGANLYRTQDGRFLQLMMMGNRDADWADLCDRLGHPELGGDPRFATASARSANRTVAVRVLDEIFASRSAADWGKLLGHGRTVWALVQHANELPHDPQVIANGFIQQVDTDRGPTPVISPAVMFDEDAGQSTRAPGFGEHTDEVLHEIGFSDAEVAAFRAADDVA